jgi:hypothetical protein
MILNQLHAVAVSKADATEPDWLSSDNTVEKAPVNDPGQPGATGRVFG